MSIPSIERLNYFNGQRLEAADFRVEQDFHIRVQRLLNRSLFTPGIAAGLEVEKVLPEPAHAVRVLPGLALDSEGRAVILVEPREVPVAGRPTDPGDPVNGNYLVIEYFEEPTTIVSDGCAVQLGVTCRAVEDISWGAPSRIRSEPQLSIQHQWPKPNENKIVLAQLELDKGCAVRDIRTFVRKYVGASKPAKVRALTLEGEKDLDSANPKELYFHIENGTPDKVSLYLRGAEFSSVYYTELGSHTHTISIQVTDASQDFVHTHTLKDGVTDEAGEHVHGLNMDEEDIGVDHDSKGAVSMVPIQPAGKHTHKLSGLATDPALGPKTHGHSSAATAQSAGSSDAPARAGNALTYIGDLRVAFDGKDVTPAVLSQLTERDGPGVWQKIGDGTALHKFSAPDGGGAVEGTGEIDLLRLGIDLAPGEHRLTLSVPAGGGKVLYNLYVE